MVKKESVIEVFNKTDEFLKKHKISGIIFIPGYGSATIFRNDFDKLVILDHAMLEQSVEDKKRDDEVIRRIANEMGNTESLIPYYIR